jgi:hypothetical protein
MKCKEVFQESDNLPGESWLLPVAQLQAKCLLLQQDKYDSQGKNGIRGLRIAFLQLKTKVIFWAEALSAMEDQPMQAAWALKNPLTI